MNIAEIRKHVTCFSEELVQKVKERDEVVVGGKIIGIVPPLGEAFPQYVLMLDDFVGVTHVYVPENVFDAHSNELQIGKVVFLEGIASFVERKIKDEMVKEAIVYSYSMKDTSS